VVLCFQNRLFDRGNRCATWKPKMIGVINRHNHCLSDMSNKNVILEGPHVEENVTSAFHASMSCHMPHQQGKVNQIMPLGSQVQLSERIVSNSFWKGLFLMVFIKDYY
jgi:hypothetical protein